MVKSLELTDEEMKKVSSHCKKRNVEFMATPFSLHSLDFLVNECNMRIIKIGSGEIINLELLYESGKTGLPVILSTGMAKDVEIDIAINELIRGFISKKFSDLCSLPG